MPARCTASLAVLNNAAMFRSHVPGSSAAYGLRHDRSKTADTSLWKPRTTSNQVPAFYEDTACECERFSNCKMIFRLLYWAYRKFSGGCCNDRTYNATREPTLPHLRRSSCRIPAAQMTGEHELQSMESEIAAIAQGAHHFCLRPCPWKAGTMHFPRGKPLLCGESKDLAARLRKPCAS